MLAELSIKNFAIIETLNVSFDKGLTVLTGETGAGKSIIIDAIHLLVGGRASSEFVRYGCEKAEIEGLFQIEEQDHPCLVKFEEYGIDWQEGMVILRRDIAQNGKSICRVNGKLVTLAVLKEIGSTIIDIHGQHEHQDLMRDDRHLTMLDQYAGDELQQLLVNYKQTYQTYQKQKQALAKLSNNEQEMAHRLDLLLFQHDEIEKAALQENEDERLMEEKLKYANFHKLFESLNRSYQALSADQAGLDYVRLSMNELETVSDLDRDISEALDVVSNSYYMLEDAASRIRQQLDLLEYDPNRLNEVESRLNEISMLKRKYGTSVEEILTYQSKIATEIETIQNRESYVAKMSADLVKVEATLLEEATTISLVRQQAAKRLIEAIHHELKDLYMEKAKFDIVFTQRKSAADQHSDTMPVKFLPTGIDDIVFYISTNPGEPLKPMSKVASGGELSRIMLAMKSIFSVHQGVTSIIFDEVDTGVSGRVAQAIGEKIYNVAHGSQVLCISHLPQVAAMADHHYFIMKQIVEERTMTAIKRLTLDEKVEELARMIAGVEITDVTRTHAKEMLLTTKKVKQ